MKENNMPKTAQENKTPGKKSVFASKRFKYGSVAVAFTVVFVAFVILLNAVFTAVANYNGGFYIDLTGEKIYDISDSTAQVLADLDRKVEIIFCVTEDRVSDSDELTYVKRLAEKYRTLNDRVSLVYRDCVKDPVYFNQFKKTSADTISQNSVIINCPETKRYIVYPLVRFFKLSSETRNIFAYDGENKLTGAIMQTAVGEPQKAGFITGHGEEKRSSVESLLREQGYEVSDVDLKSTTEEQLADYDLLIISNPKYDYTGISAAKEGRVNEIGLLNSYLTKSYGNLMVFISPETPELSEFSNFLSDDWGVSYVSGDVAVEGSSVRSTPTDFTLSARLRRRTATERASIRRLPQAAFRRPFSATPHRLSSPLPKRPKKRFRPFIRPRPRRDVPMTVQRPPKEICRS